MKKKTSNIPKRERKNRIKGKNIIKIICTIAILIVSLYSNNRFPFPHFLFFFIIFIFIGVGASFAVLYYNQTIDAVISLTVKEPPCEKARIIIQKYHKNVGVSFKFENIIHPPTPKTIITNIGIIQLIFSL